MFSINKEVLNYLPETFVRIRRQDKWKNGDNEQKVKTCQEILHAVAKATTVNQYIELLDFLHTKEAEEAKAEKRYFFTAPLREPPYLQSTIAAMRSFILDKIQNEPEFVQLLKKLNKEIRSLELRKKELNKSELEKLQSLNLKKESYDNSKNSLKVFFENIMKKYDPIIKVLKEENWQQVEKNISLHKRTRVITSGWGIDPELSQESDYSESESDDEVEIDNSLQNKTIETPNITQPAPDLRESITAKILAVVNANVDKTNEVNMPKVPDIQKPKESTTIKVAEVGKPKVTEPAKTYAQAASDIIAHGPELPKVKTAPRPYNATPTLYRQPQRQESFESDSEEEYRRNAIERQRFIQQQRMLAPMTMMEMQRRRHRGF